MAITFCDSWTRPTSCYLTIWPSLLFDPALSCFILCWPWVVSWLHLQPVALVLLLFTWPQTWPSFWPCSCLLIWYSVVSDPGLSWLWLCFQNLQVPIHHLCAPILYKLQSKHPNSIQTVFWSPTLTGPTTGTHATPPLGTPSPTPGGIGQEM